MGLEPGRDSDCMPTESCGERGELRLLSVDHPQLDSFRSTKCERNPVRSGSVLAPKRIMSEIYNQRAVGGC